MAFIGTILQEVVKQKSAKRKKKIFDSSVQEKTLKKLLLKAKNTDFGSDYNFSSILSSKNIIKDFQKNVPIFDYETLFEEYWHRTLAGEEDVAWPGRIKYFALTSGTSESASKRIPISVEMIQNIRKVSINQTFCLSKYDFPPSFYQKSVLMLGGSTALTKIGNRYEGDLSGIMAGRLPIWFQNFYKPGAKISQLSDWPTKLEMISDMAVKWDIGICAGVPAWYQILFKKIIEKHNVATIHDIWPNLKFFVHGGVSYEPYRHSFEQLLGEEIHFLETYLASEGFLAIQVDEKKKMQFVMDKGIFFEFIPFDDTNFDSEGHIVEKPEALSILDTVEGVEYAILISTCSGAWRYLIGDTVKIINKQDNQMIITGRTRHFLNLCGEHLSVDNMNQAIRLTGEDLGININEYAVAGIPHENLFAHKWYIGVDEMQDSITPQKIKTLIDKHLEILNDDYIVERKAALKELFVEILPVQWFYDYMKMKGKEGGQNKFPRVLRNEILKEWEDFIKAKRNV